jgi:dTDP-glucose 4,6-dehydratase
VRDGATVTALCRYTSEGRLGNLEDLAFDVRDSLNVEFGDLCDGDFVREAVRQSDAVFHLGASISVPYSYVAPREVVTTNILGTLNVLQAVREAEVRRMIQFSSSEVYGTAQYVPIDEEHPLHAQSPYAASKVGADKLAETFNLSFGVPVVIMRPFNTYGPRQSLRAVVAAVAAQAVAGDVIRLGSLVPRRDFVFVSDTVAAAVLLAGADGHQGETFNVSTGADVSIADVVAIVGDLVGRRLEVIEEEERLRPETSEVYRLIGSAEKLNAAVGWEPVTPLREGLEHVVEWFGRRTAGSSISRYVV